MIPTSNQSSVSLAVRIGAFFGVLEGMPGIVVLVVYILHVQSGSHHEMIVGLFAWGILLIPWILILFYYQRTLRRLGIARSWRLIAFAGGTSGFCVALISAGSHAVINLSNHSLYQAIVALAEREGPFTITEFTLQALPLWVVGAIVLNAVYLVVVMMLSPTARE